MNLNEVNYVVFDLETTGLNAKEDYIIEIAAQKCDANGNLIDQFSTLVTIPEGVVISPQISQITHISQDMLEGGMDIDSAMHQFYDFVDNAIIVGQNVEFDLRFVMQYFLKQDIAFAPVYLDLIKLTKFINPNLENYKLHTLVNYYELAEEQDAYHRALYDTNQTRLCFIKALSILKGMGIDSVVDLLSINKWQWCSDKQYQFVSNLMERTIFFETKYIYFSKMSASFHIDFLLNKE